MCGEQYDRSVLMEVWRDDAVALFPLVYGKRLFSRFVSRCMGNKVNWYGVVDTILLDCDRIWRDLDDLIRTDGFRQKYKSAAC